MRQFLIYFAVVTLLATAMAQGEFNASGGTVTDLNIILSYPVDPNTSWAGLYGSIGVVSGELASYYDGAFGYIVISPLDINEVTESVVVNLRDQLHVTDLNNWYIVFSESPDLNFSELNSTCDTNLDSYLLGNFCPECTPERTFTLDENVYVNNHLYCTAYAYVYDGAPSRVLIAPDGNMLYMGDIGEYNILGSTHNFGVLLSLPAATSFYIYLVRKQIYCGDGVCDPGEESGCSDCVNFDINVSPTSRDANVDQSAQYSVTITNLSAIDLTQNYFYPRLVVFDGNSDAISYSFSKSFVYLDKYGDSETIGLTVSASAPGDYGMRVEINAEGVIYSSNAFYLHVPTPPTEEENAEAPPSGSGAPSESNVVEENTIQELEGGGFYIPWMRCISNVRVSGPDRVNALREENVTINLLVQNGGTCEENIEISVEISPEEEYSIAPTEFSVPAGTGKRLVLNVTPKKAGLHTIIVHAKGFVDVTHRMDLMVSKETYSGGERECNYNMLIVAPENIAIVEGEDVNNILVSNFGSCREHVLITLYKIVGDAELKIDAKDVYISPNERFNYSLPKLAAGKYKLVIKTSKEESVSYVTVAPRPITSSFADVFTRGGLAVLAVLLLLLVIVAGYVRYRYLS